MRKIITATLALSALLVAGCGDPSEEEFAEDAWGVTCDLIFECTPADELQAAIDSGFWFFGEDVGACKELYDPDMEDTDDTDSCEYDSGAAKECLDALESLTCDEVIDGEYELPAVCDKVCV